MDFGLYRNKDESSGSGKTIVQQQRSTWPGSALSYESVPTSTTKSTSYDEFPKDQSKHKMHRSRELLP